MSDNAPKISRELMGKIVDEVFDGAIEDCSVIEEIYAAIKRHEADEHPTTTAKMTGRWRMFEEATGPGYWGIELEDAGNDDDAILYPIKAHRDTIARIVEAHNAALATSEGRSELADKYDTGTTS